MSLRNIRMWEQVVRVSQRFQHCEGSYQGTPSEAAEKLLNGMPHVSPLLRDLGISRSGKGTPSGVPDVADRTPALAAEERFRGQL